VATEQVGTKQPHKQTVSNFLFPARSKKNGVDVRNPVRSCMFESMFYGRRMVFVLFDRWSDMMFM
jgi:hypothetical protein